MKRILFGFLLIMGSMIFVSCGSDPAPAAAASSSNALPLPSVDCGGNQCIE